MKGERVPTGIIFEKARGKKKKKILNQTPKITNMDKAETLRDLAD